MMDTTKLGGAGLLALLFGLGCGEPAAEEHALARPVVVVPVTVSTIEERIQATGELDAKERAVLASEVDGVVTELAVDEGDRVEEGGLLLAVDPEKRALAVANVRAMQRDAEAALAEAGRDAARVRKLHGQGIASDAALDKAETGLSRARARVEASRAELGVSERALRDANVRAPFAGWIARRDVSRGEYVRPGQPLFELVALDPIEVEFSVAELDSARVAIGQQVQVEVAPYPQESFQGLVTVISPTLDPKTRTLRVKAQIANGDGRLRPGLFARADLGIARREGALLVPEEAVLQRADGEVLFVVTPDDMARRVVVTTGLQRDGKIEIVSGVAEQDQVVVRGHAVLVDGVPVTRRSLAAGGGDEQSLNAAAERGAGAGTL
jgi:membrane fusion protein (multidrug efflux system)